MVKSEQLCPLVSAFQLVCTEDKVMGWVSRTCTSFRRKINTFPMLLQYDNLRATKFEYKLPKVISQKVKTKIKIISMCKNATSGKPFLSFNED